MSCPKLVLDGQFCRDCKDYPEEDGYYWVFRVDKSRDGYFIDRVERLEFIQIDEEYPSQWQGWQDIQYEVENGIYDYVWTKELELK